MKLQVLSTVKIKEVPNELPEVASVNVDLILDKRLRHDGYFDGPLLNQAGVKVVTAVLVQSMAANIAGAAKHGIRDQDEHVEFVIAEIKRSLAAQLVVR